MTTRDVLIASAFCEAIPAGFTVARANQGMPVRDLLIASALCENFGGTRFRDLAEVAEEQSRPAKAVARNDCVT